MDVSSITRQGWQHGGAAATLEISADQDFVTSDGEVVKAGYYKSIACTVSGEDLTIPQFPLSPTTNAPSNTNATWTARFVDQQGTPREYWLSSFKLSHAQSSPTNWPAIFLYNNPPPYPGPPPAINYIQAQLLIAEALANLQIAAADQATMAAGSATVSDTSIEANDIVAVFSQSDGVSGSLRVITDPGVGFTITSSNDLDAGTVGWIKLKAGTSFPPPPSGSATMVNGTANVANTELTGAELINAFSVDAGVMGPLQVIISPGVGFTIQSANGGDNGNVGWFRL